MKNLLFLLILILSFLSCNKESEKIMTTNVVKVKQLNQFIPNTYDNDSTIVFMNLSNEEIKLNINKYTTTRVMNENGNNLNVESIEYNLENKEHDIILGVSATIPNGDNLGEIEVLSVNNNLYGNSDNGFAILNIPVKDFQILNDSGLFIFHENIELEGQVYFDVMESVSPINTNSHSKIYYNSDLGVVGFMDVNNTIWVKK